MKISILLIFISVFNLLAEPSYSQSEKISLKLANVNTIENVISEIERTTDYVFIYNEDVISTLKNEVDVEVTNQSLDEVLNLLLEGTDLAYSLSSKQVTLYKDESKKIEANSSTIERLSVQQQTKKNITGTVVDEQGEPIIGANIIERGTSNGTVTDIDGKFTLRVDDNAILRISYIGYNEKEVATQNQINISVILEEDTKTLDELVVVGYGTQKKSDITGTVASMPKERLELVPNLNIAQAIQGAVPGVMIQTSSAGASPSETIMVRGRNSIRASNNPLIVVDGIPYGGNISDINPNDVESLEVLKDASAAAIYGSRGSNGVILITTKAGTTGKTTISYDGYASFQDLVKLPDVMNGEEFYNFKQDRWPGAMTSSEEEIFLAGPDEWIDWIDLGMRKGFSQQHNLSVSGAVANTNFYISGGLLDVKGLVVNDNYQRLTNRINLDTKIGSWLELGTRTTFTHDDNSGDGPSMSELFMMNPLTKSLDENGNYLIYPWAEDTYFGHPLAATLYDNISKTYQIVTNNYAIVNVPFIEGLSYRLNSGIRFRHRDDATYRGRDTKSGFESNGNSNTQIRKYTNTVIENIVSYNKEIDNHNLFFTGVYSYENDKYDSQSISARGFPHDFLTWYAAEQAELSTPSYDFNETVLLSQMLRLNYSYDSRYLVTLTGRRDGFSGFGSTTKWGTFPSVALGWNVTNEDFLNENNLFSNLKVRASWGLNGNQAVGAYESISRLKEQNMVYGGNTHAGYIPSVLGQDELGWESSSTFNIGLDVGILNNRVTAEMNLYQTRTTDLLLNRSISSVHGISSITQNIGETQNNGFEVSFNSRNIISNSNNFSWTTSGNFAYVKNKIVSLYGIFDEDGKEIDDAANAWFIGQPIRVNYHWAWDGVWQTNEADEAAKYGSKPGFVKLRDANKDGKLDADDRVINGQRDPKVLWGLTNAFSYRNFTLQIFIHGVHGVTKHNTLMTDDDTYTFVRRRTVNKNWWTPDNPTNDWVANNRDAERMAGLKGNYYENADFIRIKDISLSYDFPQRYIEQYKLSRLRLYLTGRNQFTFTNWSGLDPELSEQFAIPLQKEFVVGVNFSF